MICFPKGKPPFVFIIICISFIGKEVKTAPADHTYTNKSSGTGECYCGADQKIYLERLEQSPSVTYSSGLFTECNAFGVTMCYQRCRNETSVLVKKLCEKYGHVVDMQGFLFYKFCTAPRWQNIGRVKHVAQICCHNNKPVECNKMKITKRAVDFPFIEKPTIKANENPTYISIHPQDKNFVRRSYLDNTQELEITEYLIKNSMLNNETPRISEVLPTSQEINDKNNGSSLDNKHEKEVSTKVSFLQRRSVTNENNFKLQLNNNSQVNETVNRDPRNAESINVTKQKEKTDKKVTNPSDEIGLNETALTLRTTEGNTSFIKVYPALTENTYYTPNDTQNQTNSKVSDSKLSETNSTKRVSRQEVPSSEYKCTKRETKENNKKIKNSTTSRNEIHKVLNNSNISEQEREINTFNKSESNITEDLTLSNRKCPAHCNSENGEETVSGSNNTGVVISIKVSRSPNNQSLKMDEKFEIPVERTENKVSTITIKTGTNTEGLPETRHLEHNKEYLTSKKGRDIVLSTNNRISETIFKENNKLNEHLHSETIRSNRSFKMKRDIADLNNITTVKPVIKEHTLIKNELSKTNNSYNSSKGDNKIDFSISHISHNKSLDTVVNKQEIIPTIQKETNKQESGMTRKSRQSISLRNEAGTAMTGLIFSETLQSESKKEHRSPIKERETSSISNINLTTIMNDHKVSQNSTKVENGSLVNVSSQSNTTHGSTKNLTDPSVNKTKVRDIHALTANINLNPDENYSHEGKTKRTSGNETTETEIKDYNLQKSVHTDPNKNQSDVRKIREVRLPMNNTINSKQSRDSKISKDAPFRPNKKPSNGRNIRDTTLTINSTIPTNEEKENPKITENTQTKSNEENSTAKKISGRSLSINYTKPSEVNKSPENEQTEPSKENTSQRKIRDTISVNNTSETIVRKNIYVNESEQLYLDKKENGTRKVRETPLPVKIFFEIIFKGYDQKSSEAAHLNPVGEQSNQRKSRDSPIPVNSTNPLTTPIEHQNLSKNAHVESSAKKVMDTVNNTKPVTSTE